MVLATVDGRAVSTRAGAIAALATSAVTDCTRSAWTPFEGAGDSVSSAAAAGCEDDTIGELGPA
eukprot:gene31450-16686_t